MQSGKQSLPKVCVAREETKTTKLKKKQKKTKKKPQIKNLQEADFTEQPIHRLDFMAELDIMAGQYAES
ncbi:hypothetical protein llap_3787 [Limosa lapponica baueri]|uniref:Uncharacterized protein n=1 Tax=Limosa lapponica baueri TaxID=1758121 RepID=A0A2I0UIM7_LIMLA|nr:hypothetical protein llap_3787 [Limosa lapponica baueri]